MDETELINNYGPIYNSEDLPRYQNPDFKKLTKSDGVNWGILSSDSQTWEDGLIETLGQEIESGPSHVVLLKNTKGLVTIAECDDTLLSIQIRRGTSFKLYSYKVREGVSVSCLCNNDGHDTETIFKIVSPDSRIMLTRGPRGYALLQVPDHVFDESIRQRAGGAPLGNLVKKLIFNALREHSAFMRLYWVETPGCSGHGVIPGLQFECRFCEGENHHCFCLDSDTY
jgi:hypothetical protein